MTLRQGVEIKLTGDPTKELRFLLGPGGLPRGYPWRGYGGPETQAKELYRGWCTNAGRGQPRGPRARRAYQQHGRGSITLGCRPARAADAPQKSTR